MLRLWQFLSTEGFQPHGESLLWRADVFWTHVVADAVIVISCITIPAALIYIAYKRPDFIIRRTLYLLSAFIIATAFIHLFDIWTMWVPDYPAAALFKVLAATISAATAILLWPLMPRILIAPSPKQMTDKNADLALEIDRRTAAQQELQTLNRELEQRVRERTDELQKSNAELRHRESELSRSNAELEQFAYLASHDLQEPLRIISSYCELLQTRYSEKLDDEGIQFLEFAVDGSDRMRSLIDDLLRYSRVGRGEIEQKPVTLADAVDTATASLSAAIAENDATVSYENLPVVSGDAGLLAQVFQNLIGNAIKFRADDPPEIRISASRDNGQWTISVSDNGIGIDPQFAERVFRMFQRLHGRDAYPGNGLGLALCQRIVVRHGGTIWMAPSQTAGTTVCFTLNAA